MTASPPSFQPLSSASLQDRYGRTVDYLRVSVTDKCDLRCTYCMPRRFRGFEEPEHWLTFDEIERVVAAFVRMGTRRVRLTGGEPLLRRGKTVHQPVKLNGKRTCLLAAFGAGQKLLNNGQGCPAHPFGQGQG